MIYAFNDGGSKKACRNTVLMELRKKVETCLTLLGHISLVGVLCSGNSMMEELRKLFESP